MTQRELNQKIDRLLKTRSPAKAIQYARDASAAVPNKAEMWDLVRSELEDRYPDA